MSRTPPPKVVITGGTAVLPGGLQPLDLLIEDGRIALVGVTGALDARGGEVFDAGGLIIFPGVMDAHVHFETGSAHCDTLPDVARAAALGGTTTLLGHVSGSQHGLLDEVERQKALVGDCPIDVAFHAILTPEDDPDTLVPRLVEAGVTSFKVFMAYQDRGLGLDEALMLRVARAVARAGGTLLVHCEVGAVIEALEAELAESGATAIADYPGSRPEFTEAEAIRRALWLAEIAGARLYVVHVSTPSGLEHIERERRRALRGERPPVFAETCPKYLALNEEAYGDVDRGARAIVAPPLRSELSRLTLERALWAGAFDTLGSDHSPHPLASKRGTQFKEVRAGAPGAETFFPVLLDAALRTPSGTEPAPATANPIASRLAALGQAVGAGPASVFSLPGKSGSIQPGASADLVFVDPAGSTAVRDERVLTHSGFSVYHGRTLVGAPVHSMVRGRWTVRDRTLVQESGGRYLYGLK